MEGCRPDYAALQLRHRQPSARACDLNGVGYVIALDLSNVLGSTGSALSSSTVNLNLHYEYMRNIVIAMTSGCNDLRERGASE